MAPLTVDVALLTVHIVKDRIHPGLPGYQTIALALRNMGLRNGDRLAVVGFGKDCYYARCARLRVVAQIPDRREFWSLTAPELKSVTEHLASIGVKAVVAWDRPYTPAPGGWTDVKTSNSVLSVLLVPPQEPRTLPDSVR
jgi:PII-like signaling protein